MFQKSQTFFSMVVKVFKYQHQKSIEVIYLRNIKKIFWQLKVIDIMNFKKKDHDYIKLTSRYLFPILCQRNS